MFVVYDQWWDAQFYMAKVVEKKLSHCGSVFGAIVKGPTSPYFLQEIPVSLNGEDSFVDTRTMTLQANYTHIPCSQVKSGYSGTATR